MAKTKDEKKMVARLLLARGESIEKIVEETSLEVKYLKSLRGWVRSPTGQKWVEDNRLTIFPETPVSPPGSGVRVDPPGGGAPGTPVPPGSEQNTRSLGTLLPGGSGGARGSPGGLGLVKGGPGLGQLPPGAAYPSEVMATQFEKELWIKATPIVRKVALNPKMYFYYDYLVARGYDGDIGDFLLDCVNDYFTSRGMTVKIIIEEEIL